MAAVPLFVSTLDDLKARLKLSGVGIASDAQKIVETAVTHSRSSFFRILGEESVNDLLAIPYSENPTNEIQARRALANVTEVLMVRMILMKELPVLFMDSSGSFLQDWNDEAPFRESTVSSESIIKDLQKSVDDNMAVLSGDQELGSTLGAKSFTIGPSEPSSEFPGSSVLY